MPKPSPFAMGLGKCPKYLNPVRCLLSKRGKYLNGLGKGLRFGDWDYEDKETGRQGDKETRRQTEKSV